jgi:predicted 3-demethylubiquinone-9 3-methyltransferase (glyoxalase superfamily)
MSMISACLWFDNQAEEAMNFYVSIFKNAKTGKVVRNGENGPGPAGSVLTATFELDGQQFMALNGGPHFKFNEAVSFVVACRGQAEVDHYWDKLLEGGGVPSQCGWLKDRFGLSWQVTPAELIELMNDPDKEKAGRVMQAMLQMGKIEIDKLQAAYDG